MNDLIKIENENIFSDLMDRYFEGYNFEVKREDEVLQFAIKGKSEETNIMICCDPDEYTVYIGNHFHTHFDRFISDKESEHDQYSDAGENAIKFIQDFMKNEICIELTFWDGEVACAGAFDKNDAGPKINTNKNKNVVKEEKRIIKW